MTWSIGWRIVASGFEKRFVGLGPRMWIERVTASVVQDIHLVLVCPASRATVHKAHPTAIRRAEELRTLVDAAATRKLKLQVWCADANGMTGTFCWRHHLDDENLLARFIGVRTEGPARVDKEHRTTERNNCAVDCPLLFREAT